MKKMIILAMVVVLGGLFLASDESYVINKPDSSSEWARGTTKTIEWNKGGDTYPNVKIRLFSFPGIIKVLEISNSTPNSGSFSWKIPASTALGKYFIRVKALNNENWGDSAPFKIIRSVDIGVFKDHVELKKKKIETPKVPFYFKPKIISVFDAPLGALQAGTQLYLKGERFGTEKGKVLVKGLFPGGQFELENLTWVSDTKVNGFVPKSVNGAPNQEKVGVIVVTAKNSSSDPWYMGFKGREEKVLLNYDVRVVHCGQDGNFNVCNKNATGETAICLPEYAICGYHRNMKGAIGDDKGTDTYEINLKNGWKLKSMQKVKWLRSSSDETLDGPTVPFPAGASYWKTSIKWVVSPADKVWYWIKIIVEGPLGTHYK